MKIEAAILRSAHDPFVIEDVTLREPDQGEILVRLAGVGMCHTDLFARHGMGALPLIAGHEGSGVVEAVGSAVEGVAVGDHVVLAFDSCGLCSRCLDARPALCASFVEKNFVGNQSSVLDGDGNVVTAGWFGQSSFATFALASPRNAVVVDKALPLELLGPLGCGVITGAGSVLVGTEVGAGSSVAVFGAGSVGLSVVMAARVAGATTIIAVDLHESRLALATEVGATHTIIGGEDVAAQIKTVTGREGIDFSYETTGVPAVVADAVASLCSGGVCGLIGIPVGPSVLDTSVIMAGRTVVGLIEGLSNPQTLIPKLLELWQQGRFPFDKLIRTFALSEINEAERLASSGEVVKPVLVPGG
ncbi:MAG: NAD(P)-dependent alcohol dehydrogenase [Acidimicrobiales bacterium]